MKNPREFLTSLATKRNAVAALLCIAVVAIAVPVRHVGAQLSGNTAPAAVSADDGVAPAQVADKDALPPSMQDVVHVMVEMNDAPVAIAYGEALKVAQAEREAARQEALKNPRSPASRAVLADKSPVQIDSVAASQIQNQVQTLDRVQQALVPAIQGADIGGRVLFRTQRTFNGIAVMVNPRKISELAKLPGVKSVRRIEPVEQAAFSDIDFLGTRSFWTKVVPGAVGLHGENIKVAIIDSGLDYVHTNFGGPGTPEAYAATEDKDPVPNPYFPSAKVPGGYDFCGDNYRGTTGTPEQGIPQPDPNPRDNQNGHGTGVASLIGGYGVNFGGFTYFGNYDNSTPIGSMKISPGHAPNSRLYPLRVFGDAGNTTLVAQAIEWTVDPNGDGDLSDRMDVLNMSLGSAHGYPDYTNAIAASNAAAAGITVVISAGNNSDTYYVVGSPSVAPNTLSVAASFNDQAGFIYDSTVTVNQPGSIAGQVFYGVKPSQSAQIPPGGLTGDVVYAKPADGGPAQTPASTAPYDNAAFMAGKICLVDRGGGVSFEQKTKRAIASGAIAVLIANIGNHPDDPPLNVGLFFDSPIPVVGISENAGNALKAAAAFDSNGVSTSSPPLNVTLRPDNGSVSRPGTQADTLPAYSSRGPSLGNNAVKPDLTAPAEIVGVAQTLGGSNVRLFNGTSSAAPHVAGGMALMKQLHPTWSVQELNALAANTATHDLFVASPSASPVPSPNPQIGVGRIGAGRVDFDKASKANVVAYNENDYGQIGVSFGVVEVPVDGTSSLTKSIKVVNKGASSVTYNLTYQDVTPVTGANFAFPAGGSFTVAAGASSSIPVAFTATGNALKHQREASVAATQAVTGGTLPRHWLTEKTGYAVFTPTSGSEPTIRVALYAAPKPIAAMRAATSGVVPTANTGTFSVPLTGAGINTGALPSSSPSPDPFGIISLVKPLELQYASPQAGQSNAPSEAEIIKHVGITSDYVNRAANAKANTRITIGIDGFGDMNLPSSTSGEKDIYFDTNLDGVEDFALYFSQRPSGTNPSNVYFPVLVNLNTGSAVYLGFYTNGLPSNSADTNIFNNSAHTVTIGASSLGLIGANGTGPTRFNYYVASFDHISGDLLDQTPVMTYDVAAPGLEAQAGQLEPSYLFDLPGNSIPVNYNGTNYQANGSLGMLLLHMHNGRGNRSEAIAFRKPTIRSFTPTSGAVGTDVTIRGANYGPGTVVTFSRGRTATDVRVISENTIIAKVPSGAVTGPIRVSNAAGTSVSSQVFTVTPSPAPSPSPSPSPTASPTQ